MTQTPNLNPYRLGTKEHFFWQRDRHNSTKFDSPWSETESRLACSVSLSVWAAENRKSVKEEPEFAVDTTPGER